MSLELGLFTGSLLRFTKVGDACVFASSFPPPTQAFEGRLRRESICFDGQKMDPRLRGDDARFFRGPVIHLGNIQ